MSRRGIEWGLLLAVILMVVLVFLRQQQQVRGQAELASVKTTVGALRIAFALNHLQAQMPRPVGYVVAAQRNPFMLLQRPPINYRGEMGTADALLADPGSWVYDPGCGCVGYLPMDPQWLSSPNGATTVWYRVSTGAGPLQLDAMDRYVWQGQVLQ